jgi:hypothetical protein
VQRRAGKLGVDAQQAAPVERAQRRRRQIEVVNGVGETTPLPKQRLSAAIGPFAVEARRECERIAGIDVAQCRNVRVGACNEGGERSRRAGAAQLLGANEGQG